MNKIGILISMFIFAFSINIAKADVIPQGQKGVFVCQKIINTGDYNNYDFYILGSMSSNINSIDGSMKLNGSDCLQYYKIAGATIVGVEKGSNKQIVSKEKLYGINSSVDKSDKLKSKEEYYKMNIKGSDIVLELVGGKNFFEDGTSSDYGLKDIQDNKNIFKNGFDNVVKVVSLFLSAGLISLFSILLYRKFNNKK